jgi:hypothetical protein
VVVFVEKPPQGWHIKLLRGFALGFVSSLAVVWLLRRSNVFDMPTRLFLSSLPMWLGIGLVTIGNERHPWSARLMRAASLAIAVSLLMWAIARMSH